MIPMFLVGLGALIGGFFVFANWEEVVGWLNELFPKVKKALADAGILNYVSKLFSSVSESVMRLVNRLYYKENGKFYEQTTTREIDESEVPEWAREGLSEKETDVTNRYKEEMQLEI